MTGTWNHFHGAHLFSVAIHGCTYTGWVELRARVGCLWHVRCWCRGTRLLAAMRSGAAQGSMDGPARRSRHQRAPRRLRYSAGGVTGDMEFFLHRTRTFGARCTIDAKVVRLLAGEYQRMMTEAPLVAVMLQHVRNACSCAQPWQCSSVVPSLTVPCMQVVVHNEMHSNACHLSVLQGIN